MQGVRNAAEPRRSMHGRFEAQFTVSGSMEAGQLKMFWLQMRFTCLHVAP